MTPSPYSAEVLAMARVVMLDATFLAKLSRDDRRMLLERARAVLLGDRAHRLGRQDPAPVHGRVICIPRAVFEHGHPNRRRPRLVVHPTTPTPGDAA